MVMPIGLINLQATFMQMINNLFMEMLDKGVVVFLDDKLKYITMVEELFEPLEKMFACLHKHEYFCKLKKCSL